MDILTASLVYFTVIIALVCICFMGDAEDNGLLGRTTWSCTVWLPKQAEKLVGSLPCGSSLVGCWKGTVDYVCNKPNPILQIVYLALVVGGFIAFNFEAMPYIPNRYLGEIHLYTSHASVLFTLMTFIRASRSDPGRISAENLPVYDHWPYDGFLYVKDRSCPTCKFHKPARSKHCSICNVCVSRFDHHCPWINTCVGEANYYKFLTFLLSTVGLLFYASYGIAYILMDFIDSHHLWERSFINRETGERNPASWSMVFTFVFLRKTILCMLLVLSAVMGIVVFAFYLYHVYLIISGYTTNESAKWGSIAQYYKSRDQLAKKNPEDYPELKEKPDPEVEAEKINPDTAPPLFDRRARDFPLRLPNNIYNKGPIANIVDVISPPYLRVLNELRKKQEGSATSKTAAKKSKKSGKMKSS
mmetsp:Transcript_19296/g.37831  ORF Transcript_19296/g.37831 Transcript_19296/m.37831 type:complete len:416 (+) Transcript_19296:269-1516(+)|eukprot:CAMPEP_0171519966 /NCGR_PEP_ID=MMETSP0959-20130129/6216_1 /TAXON_ID=87120 /ORGANISM="Aurantiochytrium limacinum, Strain ATCCMYA-1381" /LENGTH=415 /DNA_ID=CAMNT_0012059507 /DNA_START=216 /DNA_END=1463 /DNA_ORIENTATION=+